MKARIIPKKPPPDNRTPEEKAKDLRETKAALARLNWLYADIDELIDMDYDTPELLENIT